MGALSINPSLHPHPDTQPVKKFAPIINSSHTTEALSSSFDSRLASLSKLSPSGTQLAKTMATMGKLNLCNMRETLDNVTIPHLITESEIWTINGKTLQIIVPDEKGEMSNGMTLKVVFKEGTSWVNHSPRQLGRQVLVALALYHQ